MTLRDQCPSIKNTENYGFCSFCQTFSLAEEPTSVDAVLNINVHKNVKHK